MLEAKRKEVYSEAKRQGILPTLDIDRDAPARA